MQVEIEFHSVTIVFFFHRQNVVRAITCGHWQNKIPDFRRHLSTIFVSNFRYFLKSKRPWLPQKFSSLFVFWKQTKFMEGVEICFILSLSLSPAQSPFVWICPRFRCVRSHTCASLRVQVFWVCISEQVLWRDFLGTSCLLYVRKFFWVCIRAEVFCRDCFCTFSSSLKEG